VTDELKHKLGRPFDSYELTLLELRDNANTEAATLAARAQDADALDMLAYRAYIEHEKALARARAYGNALYFYRQGKSHEERQPHKRFLTESQKDSFQ
jgi:hypothetical protein